MRVLENQRPPETAPVRDGPIAGVAKPAGRFGLHVLEMCVVMCLSLMLLAVVVGSAAAVFGLSDVGEQSPVLSALVVASVLGASMVVWMRLRGMAWRPTLEMAGSAVAAGVLMVAGYWAGIVPASVLTESVCGVACVAMVGVMLFRFRLYSTGHHAHSE